MIVSPPVSPHALSQFSRFPKKGLFTVRSLPLSTSTHASLRASQVCPVRREEGASLGVWVGVLQSYSLVGRANVPRTRAGLLKAGAETGAPSAWTLSEGTATVNRAGRGGERRKALSEAGTGAQTPLVPLAFLSCICFTVRTSGPVLLSQNT